MRCSVVLTLFAVAALAAAGKTSAAPTGAFPLLSARSGAAPHTAAPADVVARVYWQGLKQISADTNAASFLGVWNLPETRRLEVQTLDKLASAPWRLLHRAPDTNAAALLRPLLDDVVQQPSFLEIRQTTNAFGELAFAIQLDEARAALWQTNLALVFQSLTGVRPEPAPKHRYGWTLRQHPAPNFIELTRAGDWTILGAAQDRNNLAAALIFELEHGRTVVSAEVAKYWLACDTDLPGTAKALAWRWHFPTEMPRFGLTVQGYGKEVWTSGSAEFPNPLSLDLKPWNLPTNLIDRALDSFTVARGFGRCLGSLKSWEDLQIGSPPDQICFWALRGLKMQSYFAAPLPDASNAVSKLTDLVLQKDSTWFDTNVFAGLKRSKAFNGLEWGGVPFMWPFIRSTSVSNRNFVYGGFFTDSTPNPISIDMLQGIFERTNLVYHDWEVTGTRIEQWVYMGQFIRWVTGRPQLPAGSAGLAWLRALAPKLGDTTTDITQTGPAQLSLVRKSSFGFTALELHLLADWLESPRFPLGLHSITASPKAGAPELPHPKAGHAHKMSK